jgi:nicotinamidase-related amidase
MPGPLLVVDVQLGFLNDFSRHIPERVARLIGCGSYDPILFTRFVNVEDGPYPKFLDWHGCSERPDIDIAPDLERFAREEMIFTKPGYAGVSDKLAAFLQEHKYEEVTIVGIDTDMCVLKIALDVFDLNIRPIVLIDCCASTAGLQSHLTGLAILARNIGAGQLHDAGLGNGRLAAP